MKLSREYLKVNCKEIGDRFLRRNKNLSSIELPMVEKIGYNFLLNNTNLTSIKAPLAEKIGDCFLYLNQNPQINEIKQRILKGKL